MLRCHSSKMLLSIFLLLIAEKISAASPHCYKMKVAIIDNFHTQRFSSEKYAKYYLNGIQLAITEAKIQKIDIQYKVFSYGQKPLDIFDIVPQVQKWQPTIIIGPRSSNQFLLLKNKLKNVMVLSPYATSDDIIRMPRNFYSIPYSDSYSIKSIITFCHRSFAKRKIYILAKSNCKSCSDTARLFSKLYKKKYPQEKTITHIIPMDHIDDVQLNDLLAGASKDDIIFLPNPGFETAILMKKITDFLNRTVVFIGNDNWGSWNDGMIAKIKAHYPYQGFRLTPWSTDAKEEAIINFGEHYLKKFHELPDGVSYASYITLNSALFAVRLFSSNCSTDITASCALKAYQRAALKNPDWFKPQHYYIYKTTQHGEQILGSISIEK